MLGPGQAAPAQEGARRGLSALRQHVRVQDQQELRRGKLLHAVAQPAQQAVTHSPPAPVPTALVPRAQTAGVRQPLCPRPLRLPALIVEDAHREVRGTAVHRGLHQEAARHRHGGVTHAHDPHHAPAGQVHLRWPGSDPARLQHHPDGVVGPGAGATLQRWSPGRVPHPGREQESIRIVMTTLPHRGGGHLCAADHQVHGRRLDPPRRQLRLRRLADRPAEGLQVLLERGVSLAGLDPTPSALLHPVPQGQDRAHGADQGVAEIAHHDDHDHRQCQRSQHRDQGKTRGGAHHLPRGCLHRIVRAREHRPRWPVEGRRARAGDVVQRPRARRWRLLDVTADLHHATAHTEHAVVGDARALLVQPRPLHAGPVGGTLVAQTQRAVLLHRGSGVQPGHAGGVHREVGLRRPADRRGPGGPHQCPRPDAVALESGQAPPGQRLGCGGRSRPDRGAVQEHQLGQEVVAALRDLVHPQRLVLLRGHTVAPDHQVPQSRVTRDVLDLQDARIIEVVHDQPHGSSFPTHPTTSSRTGCAPALSTCPAHTSCSHGGGGEPVQHGFRGRPGHRPQPRILRGGRQGHHVRARHRVGPVQDQVGARQAVPRSDLQA